MVAMAITTVAEIRDHDAHEAFEEILLPYISLHFVHGDKYSSWQYRNDAQYHLSFILSFIIACQRSA